MSWKEIKLLIDQHVDQTMDKVIAWRRDLHEHPELSNQEYRTAALVAEHLENLGMEVQTNVAKTGVVGLLIGALPGSVVALRADMDALPVTEACDLPFTSKVKAMYNGDEVGVMHACGHDVHTANLMGVAEVLSKMKDQLPGTVKFIFQPAEEGAEGVETWGAKQMVEEGVLHNPDVDAIFGLHVWPFETGTITLRSGALMASVDTFTIVVHGKGTHGALPWLGVDPIVTGAQIVNALQTIVSRNVALNEGGAVITVGSFHGGTRENIISERVEMMGTIRSHNEKARAIIHKRLPELVKNIAMANDAWAEVTIDTLYPSTVNHVDLTSEMLPVLKEAAHRVDDMFPMMPAEDFSYYQQKIPGMYFFLGITPKDTPPDQIEPNHSPRFMVDEAAIPSGMKALCYLTMKYLSDHKK
ncbi:MAG: amidohydrolase [Prolixibacteraceae bacterium]